MKKDKDFTTRLMAFTFFYSVAIYALFIGYHFWDSHSGKGEIKEK